MDRPEESLFMPRIIRVRAKILEEMSVQARRIANEECCGILAGKDGEISAIFPAKNISPSATRYEIAPEELFRIMKEIRAAGLTMLGIYHSHPGGDNSPSATDIERAYYPDAAYFILSSSSSAPNPIRAFSIHEAAVAELKIEKV